MFLLPQSTGYWLQDKAEVRSHDNNQRTQSPSFDKRLDSYFKQLAGFTWYVVLGLSPSESEDVANSLDLLKSHYIGHLVVC